MLFILHLVTVTVLCSIILPYLLKKSLASIGDSAENIFRLCCMVVSPSSSGLFIKASHIPES